MKIRLAKLSDAGRLAQVHWIGSSKQPGGFMFRLGRAFLIQYYRVLLEEKNSVVICAEDTDGHILGFVSGSLDAEERMIALRRNWFRLSLAAIPALIRDPRLIRDMYSRRQSKSADREDGGYIVQSGARVEYWAWLPTHSGGAIELHLKWLLLMRLLGVQSVRGEVDQINEMVLRAHRFMGARVVKEFTTPDGKQRLVIEYMLK